MGYGYGWGGQHRWGHGYGRGRGGGWRWGWQAGPTQPLPQLQPPPPNAIRVVAGVEADRGLDSPVSMRFARAPYLAVVDVSGGRVVGVNIVQNTCAAGSHGVGVMVAQWVISIGARVVLATHVGPNAMMLLQQAGVKVVPVQPGIPLRLALQMAGLAMG